MKRIIVSEEVFRSMELEAKLKGLSVSDYVSYLVPLIHSSGK